MLRSKRHLEVSKRQSNLIAIFLRKVGHNNVKSIWILGNKLYAVISVHDM